MFSPFISDKLAAPRPPQPMTAMFSRSLAAAARNKAGALHDTRIVARKLRRGKRVEFTRPRLMQAQHRFNSTMPWVRGGLFRVITPVSIRYKRFSRLQTRRSYYVD